jgi:L-Ala-D/L-Glu epimerase / N-acetyl-D-glutamate racemase
MATLCADERVCAGAETMNVSQLRLKEIRIPFKASFRHASAERASTSSVWAEAQSSDGLIGYGEACPRPYVTRETIETVQAFTSRHRISICREIVDLESLRAWMRTHQHELDRNPAAWCAIEMAILDLFGKQRKQSVEALLSLPALTGRFRYSAVLGDAEPEAFARAVDQYCRHGFTDFKVKLSGILDRDRAKLAILKGRSPERVRLDANNLWERVDDAVSFLRAIGGPYFALEEPLRPNQYAALAGIADEVGCRIVLDESFLRVDQVAELSDPRSRWLINLRVSKMGGLLRSLDVVETLRAEGLGLVVGAQVGETSLLTRAALTVAHAGADLLVAQEGAFGTLLLTEDICDPPLMFGAGGVLDVSSHPSLERSGLGILQSEPSNRERFVPIPV